MTYKSYFRSDIDAMTGYAPGEQPKVLNLTKLNTNENPYPPSPRVFSILREFDATTLRLYPEPLADSLRDVIAELNGAKRENIIAGNGSDDILTMTIRCFCNQKLAMACIDPTYSLYSVLADLQGTSCIKIGLNDDFSLPENLLTQAAAANLLMLARPNAPTSNTFPMSAIENLCANFKGIVFIDEAYADFAEDSCMALALRFPNVIVSRTMSKSYALAGARLGYAVASKQIIDGMMKMKDSYNVNMLTQKIAIEAFRDQNYLRQTVEKIKQTRTRFAGELTAMGFKIIPSSANFLFVSPPDGNGRLYFEALRSNNIIVRYFPDAKTEKYVRISIGTDADMDRVLAVTRQIYA